MKNKALPRHGVWSYLSQRGGPWAPLDPENILSGLTRQTQPFQGKKDVTPLGLGTFLPRPQANITCKRLGPHSKALNSGWGPYQHISLWQNSRESYPIWPMPTVHTSAPSHRLSEGRRKLLRALLSNSKLRLSVCSEPGHRQGAASHLPLPTPLSPGPSPLLQASHSSVSSLSQGITGDIPREAAVRSLLSLSS